MKAVPFAWKRFHLLANTVNVSPRALTRVEMSILMLLDVGRSTQEVATELSISVGTVKCHLHHVFTKLGARNRIEAIAEARRESALASN